MRGDGQLWVSGKDTEVVEVVGSSAIIAVGVLELTKVIQGVDLFKGDLQSDNEGIERRVRYGRTYAIVLFQVRQVLVLVLPQSLCYLWVLDHVQNSLGLLLQTLVRVHGVFTLCSKFYDYLGDT